VRGDVFAAASSGLPHGLDDGGREGPHADRDGLVQSIAGSVHGSRLARDPPSRRRAGPTDISALRNFEANDERLHALGRLMLLERDLRMLVERTPYEVVQRSVEPSTASSAFMLSRAGADVPGATA
jgi:hypothetical protein